MNLYELNQAGYTSLPKMAKSAIRGNELQVGTWIETIGQAYQEDRNVYLMLLSYDTRYFTIFMWDMDSTNTGADIASEVVKLVQDDLGTLKSIEYDKANNGWEFWVTGQDAVTRMYLLFDYTEGVIEL